MKGISAVLATVLIVVITVAIIGLAYAWSTDLFSTVSESSDAQVSGQLDAMEKSIKIVAASCGTDNPVGNSELNTDYLAFSIKNTGSVVIQLDELSILLNGDNIAETDWESIISIKTSFPVGETKQLVYSLSETYPGGDVVILVDAPAGPDDKTVICPAILGFP